MTQEQTLVQGVDFICVPTRDFAKAKVFYESVLGLEMSKQWGDMPAGEFETGSLTIAVMQADAFQIEFAPHRFPISFRVDDVAARKEELEAQGVEFHTDVIDSGVCHQAIFSDPDGNALNLHHRYAPPG
ncbi:MAG: VOC family protein [Actinomycetota bacterium]|nr:VOC family protein [Actinomycetota bacterium]